MTARARPAEARERLVIIGAGPAGLATAQAAHGLNPLLVEAGHPASERDQANDLDLVRGVGGAGLFSDGKFSFWPSASRLWQLDPRLLTLAYAWFREEASQAGVSTPELREATTDHEILPGSVGKKVYSSVYVTPESREEMVHRLSSAVQRVRTSAHVVSIQEDQGTCWRVDFADGSELKALSVVLAAGRFGPLLVRRALPEEAQHVLRLEVGVRLEQESGDFFLNGEDQLDPKYIWRDAEGDLEWRTFCCCREGLVVQTNFAGLMSLSGRADCPASGRSNVGFNLRIHDPVLVQRTWAHLERAARLLTQPVTCSLRSFLAAMATGQTHPLVDVLGHELAARLASGLHFLVRDFPDSNLLDAKILGPTIEGVGVYPKHDDRLAVPATTRLWVAGDAAGSFRGLTAALVSGYVAGLAATEVGAA